MSEEKRAPVQGYSAGIPWSMHLRAYDAYCKMFGPQPALIDLAGRNCRGGFGDTELDMFIPGWREELSIISQKDAKIVALETEVAGLKAQVDTLKFHLWLNHGHNGMYGDDGEMQCSACAPFGLYDWKRSTVEQIIECIRLQKLHVFSIAQEASNG